MKLPITLYMENGQLLQFCACGQASFTLYILKVAKDSKTEQYWQ